ncbi:alpha-soluble NSF attachment protein isoform X1 [Hydra vulgaris]|uniref:Alpha-soluble NSF attachment protein n=1 Tax=Hydra vulgaris TaxID=6087 RepID=T2MEM4_HYDVU|nr:alpha-soluble NSF attachment protein [Hydra vulgaris]
MSKEEDRANEYLAEAKKNIESSKGFFGRMFGATSKIEDASSLYSRAGNSFKIAKNWKAAGDAFCEAAKLQENQLQSKHEAASQYVEAANCYRKSNFEEAINCLQQAIEIYTEMGRFSIAAKHHITIAEIYETNLADINEAINHYTKAADFYKGEESNSAANKCLLKMAFYYAQQENYKKAISIYEDVAAVCIESPLLKYSAREHYFRASLCWLCLDIAAVEVAINKYLEMFPALEDSRELKFLNKLVEAVKEENIDHFTEAVREYDSISRLDQWYTTLLLRIKKSFTGDDIDIN